MAAIDFSGLRRVRGSDRSKTYGGPAELIVATGLVSAAQLPTRGIFRGLLPDGRGFRVTRSRVPAGEFLLTIERTRRASDIEYRYARMLRRARRDDGYMRFRALLGFPDISNDHD